MLNRGIMELSNKGRHLASIYPFSYPLNSLLRSIEVECQCP